MNVYPIRLGAVVLAVVALAGCKQAQDGSPGEASAPASQPAVALGIGDAFAAADDTMRPLDPSGLTSLGNAITCSVDSINETAASDGVMLSRSERARFSGFIQAKTLEQPSILVLRSDAGAYFVRNTPTAERKDIAASKGLTDSSAFDYSTYGALEQVAPGVYTVELVGNEAAGNSRCNSSVVVTIE